MKALNILTLILNFSILFARDNWVETYSLVSQDQIPTMWISSKLVKPNAFTNGIYSATLKEEIILQSTTNSYSFKKISGPDWLVIDSNGTLSGSATESNLGLNSFKVIVSNGIETEEVTEILITVLNSNHSRTLDELNKFIIKANNTTFGKKNPFPNELKNIYEQTLLAEDDISIGNYNKAFERITPLLTKYPLLLNNNTKWNNFSSIGSKYFTNLAGNTPNGYVHLSMINEIIKTRNNNQTKTTPLKTLTLSVVLVKYSKYPKPDGSGFEIVEIDPRLRENNFQIIKERINLFSQFINTLTGGEAQLHTQFIETEESDPQLYEYRENNKTILYPNNPWDVINKIPQNLNDGSDLFYVVLPWKPKASIFNAIDIRIPGWSSTVYGKDLGRFIVFPWSTDFFLEPGYLKNKFYGPEWFQHEFFHHIYGVFKDFYNYEPQDHIWFDRKLWPKDFIGSFEGDYYLESFNRIKNAQPNIYSRLNQSPVENTPPTWQSSQINMPQLTENIKSTFDLNTIVKELDSFNFLRFTSANLPSWISLKNDGKINLNPTKKEVGLHSFKIFVTDNNSLPIETIINVNVVLEPLDTQAPTTPLNLVATNITDSALTLNWTASTDNVGVTAYDVYKDGALLTTVNSNTGNITGLSADTTYQFYVKVKDAAQNVSTNSSTISVKTLVTPDTQAPTTPLNLVATNITDSALTLNWTASTDNVGVTVYDIYKDNVLLTTVNSTTANVSGLLVNTAYEFYVKAKDTAKNTSEISKKISVKTTKFYVYPNPTDSTLYFSSPELIKEIQIYNTLGQNVYTSKSTHAIDVSNFDEGLYLLKATLNNGEIEKIQFIKK